MYSVSPSCESKHVVVDKRARIYPLQTKVSGHFSFFFLTSSSSSILLLRLLLLLFLHFSSFSLFYWVTLIVRCIKVAPHPNVVPCSKFGKEF